MLNRSEHWRADLVRQGRHDAGTGARHRHDDSRGTAQARARSGRIAPGFHADIVPVDGDPLQDILAVINGVKWVMKDGKLVVDKR